MNSNPNELDTPQSPTLSELATRLEAAEARYQTSERRFRILSSVLFIGITGILTLSILTPATAQSFNSILTALQNRVTALETKTQDITRVTDTHTSKTTVRFTGVNVQVVSGSGSTDGSINGLGNLIVGYNETRSSKGFPGTDTRTGSHNLILGYANSYSSSIGAIFGARNTSSNVNASILGGGDNIASGDGATILGGIGNTASGSVSTITGGGTNISSGNYSHVSGGDFNTSSGLASSILGGVGNTVSTFRGHYP